MKEEEEAKAPEISNFYADNRKKWLFPQRIKDCQKQKIIIWN